MPKPPTPARCCGSCGCYQPPPPVPDSAFVAVEAQALRGICRRFPAHVERRPGDWCAEHRRNAE